MDSSGPGAWRLNRHCPALEFQWPLPVASAALCGKPRDHCARPLSLHGLGRDAPWDCAWRLKLHSGARWNGARATYAPYLAAGYTEASAIASARPCHAGLRNLGARPLVKRPRRPANREISAAAEFGAPQTYGMGANMGKVGNPGALQTLAGAVRTEGVEAQKAQHVN